MTSVTMLHFFLRVMELLLGCRSYVPGVSFVCLAVINTFDLGNCSSDGSVAGSI